MSRLRRVTLLLVMLTTIAAVLVTVPASAALDAFLRPFLYFPAREMRATLAEVGLRYEQVEVTAADGVRIVGWFVPGSSGLTLLWFHGNAGNIGDRVPLLRELHAATGAAIFIVSYRGYGPSGGRPSEHGLYRDAEAALVYLRSRPDVDAGRIVYFGQSIGAAVAVELATRAAPLALILEAPFPSLRWLARQVYPWLPIWPLLGGRYDSEEKASRIAAPALVIHGEDDEIAPVSGGRAVAAALGGEVDLTIIPGAGHNDLPLVAGHEYYERIAAFLARVDRAR